MSGVLTSDRFNDPGEAPRCALAARRAAGCDGGRLLMVRPVIGLNHYDNGRPGGTDRVRLLLPFQGCRARESRLDSLTFADFTRVGTLRPDGAASLRLRSGADRLIAKPTELFGLRYRGLTGTVAGAVRYPLRVPIDRIGHPPRFLMVRSTAVLKRHALDCAAN